MLSAEQEIVANDAVATAVFCEARRGLTASPKTLSPWLFYDETGSRLFEEITRLPEYYLTRTERDLFTRHAEEIFLELGAEVTIAELGAGAAGKTGILLRAATRFQQSVLYQPIDISPSALELAREAIERDIPGVTVLPQVANYLAEPISIVRPEHTRILALYIGSSIGNFSPLEAQGILRTLRGQLLQGDSLLLGTDLAPAPGEGKGKSIETLLAAYDDRQGVTAAFNRNVLTRLNRELGTDFQLDCFRHVVRWNEAESRIEMHLESLIEQTVSLPASREGKALTLHFGRGETIHTENSYKFTDASIAALIGSAGFRIEHTFMDPDGLFAVTLATAV